MSNTAAPRSGTSKFSVQSVIEFSVEHRIVAGERAVRSAVVGQVDTATAVRQT
ncbi:MAG: hypothetical protein V3T70_10985 [Phycisphaerae bacterium]